MLNSNSYFVTRLDPTSRCQFRFNESATLLQKHARTYIRTYLHTCMHTYLHAYIATYIPTYLHTYIPTYLHTYMSTCLHAFMHTYLHTYLPPCLPACLPACRPTYVRMRSGDKFLAGQHGSLLRLGLAACRACSLTTSCLPDVASFLCIVAVREPVRTCNECRRPVA